MTIQKVITQYRVSTVGIEQYRFCMSFLLYTKNLDQYGTVKYRVYTGHPVPGIGIRYWNGIGTMCKTVPFGTFPIPCTGNTVSEQYQFLPYNSTGTLPSSTVMFTGTGLIKDKNQ